MVFDFGKNVLCLFSWTCGKTLTLSLFDRNATYECVFAVKKQTTFSNPAYCTALFDNWTKYELLLLGCYTDMPLFMGNVADISFYFQIKKVLDFFQAIRNTYY